MTSRPTGHHADMASGTTGADARAKPRRPSVMLTAHRIKVICAKIEQGVPQSAAAGSIGIPRRTLDNWLAAGRAEGATGIYRDLADAVDRARARFHESRAVAVVEHAKTDPRSAMFVLERRFPEEWAPPRDGVTVNVGVLVESAEWKDLCGRIVAALAPFPEALAAVAAEIAGAAPAAAAEVVEGQATELPEPPA